ncbi:MAG: hypothetical protein FJY97_13945 [candidate division Zixibacteria bacterium]|nr:hypothetical protein [candidate division Zixibacteria bacterium]
MEFMIEFLTSKMFLVFVILVVAYNIVRRRNKRIQARSHKRQDRLRDRIRDRQVDLWENHDSSGDSSEQDRSP